MAWDRVVFLSVDMRPYDRFITILFTDPKTEKNFETVVEPLEEIFGRMKQAQLTARSIAFLNRATTEHKVSEYVKAYMRVRLT